MSFPDHDESSSRNEELSFGGGDPDREPRLRAWSRAHPRLVAVCVAAAVLLAAGGAGGWYLHRRSQEPSPPPAVAFPEQTRFTVLLCSGYGPGEGLCPGRRKADEAEHLAVAARMRAMPELAGVAYVSEEDNRRETLALYAARGEPQETEGVAFTAHLRGTLRRSGDFAAVVAKITAFPEVKRVIRVPVDFWAGKADVAVHLCAAADAPREECTENRSGGIAGAATGAEKEAVLDRLRELPGVETVYLQDRDHLARLLGHYGPRLPERDQPVQPDQLYETFYVKLFRPAGPAGTAEMVRALEPLPGVREVTPVRDDR
ncbi:permease-like cell division protein FtsX [Planobispora siamensis]|uniref:FtsX extracellular domain-containing protein n=1 Tax=Planobispora siamensis TaxID=936338 RepID=A0A8J3SBS1_9ACTN|nr:permease-like cell division protein FtsX [Planobispora siamensis]GIH89691.1 hypothetical protein Psi01_03210 [Planobispora siamensis]